MSRSHFEHEPQHEKARGPEKASRQQADIGTMAASEARVIKADVIDGRTRIAIARGLIHGVKVGLTGHLRSGLRTIASFEIYEVRPSVSYAFVDATIDQLGNAVAVLKPPDCGPASLDIRSRVVHVAIQEGTTRITIARGSDYGVHRGMKGTLVSDSGAEGADFVIDGVDAARSYAAVQATPDEVSSHMKVVLRPITKNRASIQRRASGDARTTDVESTARAGVASASSRLPHVDAIQRAFGKHDVSGVHAHVGGEAAVASASLGARAYAMGNDVAFASSPDLHTAAHEAAHVVQQRNGVVSFAGLGAADDAHERHADQVADAVVAGRSAELLLDQSTGSASAPAEGAIQLKRADTRVPNPTRSDELRVEVVRLSLRNAQQTIEKWDGARDPEKVIFDTRTHVAEASATLSSVTLQSAQMQAIQPQMEETTHAIYEVVRMHGDRPPVTQLLERVVHLRMLLGLDPDPLASYSVVGTAKSKKDKHDESDVVGPVIDLVRMDAEAAYNQLVDLDIRKVGDSNDEREPVIAAIASRVQHHAIYAQSLLGEHPAAATAFAARIATASVPIQQIRAWIFARQNNAKLLAAFDRALDEIDGLRATAGLGSLAREPVPPLARASIEGAKKEEGALNSAKELLHTAIETRFRAFATGANRFSKIAVLTPPPPTASFWEELAKGILISVIGNLVGPAVGALVSASARAITAESLDFIANATTDSVQAIAGKIADDAFAQTSGKNDMPRNVAVFVKGLELTQIECARAAKDKVTERVTAKTISAAELTAMREDVDKSSVIQAETMTFQRAAHGFALLTAQLGLDVKDRDGEQISAMDGYFGQPMGGPRFGQPMHGSKLGTEGVARVQISLLGNGYRIEKFRLNGMVGDLARAVLELASNRLDAIGLPLELEIEPSSSGREAPAFLAIDERGGLRATKGWQALQGDTSWTPEQLWNVLRRASIPKSVVEKG